MVRERLLNGECWKKSAEDISLGAKRWQQQMMEWTSVNVTSLMNWALWSIDTYVQSDESRSRKRKTGGMSRQRTVEQL